MAARRLLAWPGSVLRTFALHLGVGHADSPPSASNHLATRSRSAAP